jgi:DNA-binding transcriptional ArsR family regulator
LALDNEVRREILILLANGPHPAGDIAETLARSRSGISQHLAQLLSASLVSCERRGPQRIYSLNPAQALDAWDRWVERGAT